MCMCSQRIVIQLGIKQCATIPNIFYFGKGFNPELTMAYMVELLPTQYLYSGCTAEEFTILTCIYIIHLHYFLRTCLLGEDFRLR